MATNVAVRRTSVLWLTMVLVVSGAANKKPLFEYDDHYVMLNDFGRNEFYRRALSRALPSCGDDCSVLDVGAGSGLLSMLAAGMGASQVLALEANPALATLAEQTIKRNQQAGSFAASNVTVVAELSSKVGLDRLPGGRKADVLVTETFGTMLLGEGAINFVPDARDRLLKEGGTMVPAGGCQYVTLVEAPDFAATLSPVHWGGLNLTSLELLQDSVYWKATVGASRSPLRSLSERLCVLEVDLYRDTRDSVPSNRTYLIKATSSGTVHAALFDWDVWADASRSDILSTAAGSRNFAGDVAWGQLLQLQEEAAKDWQLGSHPQRLTVKEGEWLRVGVEFIARGISIHVRVQRAASPDLEPGKVGGMPAVGSPARIRSSNRGAMIEANELLLPVAGDRERQRFYHDSLQHAVAGLKNSGHTAPTILDCSSNAGIPVVLAAKEQGLHSLALTRRSEFAKTIRAVVTDNGVEEMVDVLNADPRDLLEAFLPSGRRVDVVVLDPPGTPLHGLSPFALLPRIRKYLLREGGLVLPAGGCLEAGLIESTDLAHMHLVPDGGRWKELDLTVWNEEAMRQGVLERLVPYTKWLGSHSKMAYRWLSKPRCIFEVDLNTYGTVDVPPLQKTLHALNIEANGRAHAVAARWVAWGTLENRSLSLDAESEYLGRGLTWPNYVQALAAQGQPPGSLEPMSVQDGESWQLEVAVRQGSGKVTGSAGPEFSFKLLGTAAGNSEPSGDTEL